MNSSKKINISYSSLVGLKAELLRKQAEVTEARSKNKATAIPTNIKSKLVRKSSKDTNSKVDKPIKSKDVKAREIEDVNDLKKSRYMLEAKSKLYDKLKKNHGDRSHNYLVDFSNKPISSSSSEDEIYQEEDYEDRNSDPEDDWVEYNDCFGRTRKCLRRDLPRMKEKDKIMKQEVGKEPMETLEPPPPPPPLIPPPNEPELEKLRKKWEEQTEKLSHKTDIHYQDILFDEARAHGVGYYAFSQDEDERLKQQENLAKLRKETTQRQKEVQSINELKAQMEKNRLKAARVRQRIRAGLPAESAGEEEVPNLPEKSVEAPEPSKEPETSPKSEEKTNDKSLCIIEDKIQAFAELLGKRPKFRELSQEEWIHKRRKDRMGEFAPVYDNFKSGGLLQGTRDNQVVKADNNEDPLRIKADGPEPTDFWESQGPQYLKNKELNSNQDPRTTSGDEYGTVGKPGRNEEVESSDIIGPVPPTEFTNLGNPSFSNDCIPSHTIDNVSANASYADPSLTIIPSIEILRSVPPPMFRSTFTINCEASSVQRNNEVMDKDDEESAESDASELIGPLPPVDEDLTHIPLPQSPPQPGHTNINVNQISEGLKFLRKKFDTRDQS